MASEKLLGNMDGWTDETNSCCDFQKYKQKKQNNKKQRDKMQMLTYIRKFRQVDAQNVKNYILLHKSKALEIASLLQHQHFLLKTNLY